MGCFRIFLLNVSVGFSPGTLPDTVITKTSMLSTGVSEAVDGYCSLRGPMILKTLLLICF